jgi:hypothetical protein
MAVDYLAKCHRRNKNVIFKHDKKHEEINRKWYPLALWINFTPFIELYYILPCSKYSATGSYPQSWFQSTQSYLKIHFDIVPTSTLRSPNFFLSLAVFDETSFFSRVCVLYLATVTVLNFIILITVEEYWLCVSVLRSFLRPPVTISLCLPNILFNFYFKTLSSMGLASVDRSSLTLI